MALPPERTLNYSASPLLRAAPLLGFLALLSSLAPLSCGTWPSQGCRRTPLRRVASPGRGQVPSFLCDLPPFSSLASRCAPCLPLSLSLDPMGPSPCRRVSVLRPHLIRRLDAGFRAISEHRRGFPLYARMCPHQVRMRNTCQGPIRSGLIESRRARETNEALSGLSSVRKQKQRKLCSV